jgi:uncharacterized protein (DUF169 family)
MGAPLAGAASLAEKASIIEELVGDGTSPVAVFLLAPGDDATPFAAFQPLQRHRYCQAIMRARHGASVTLDGPNLSCPAAAAAFGFRPLPPALASGRGLVGFGIVADPAVGKAMFEGMPRLPASSIARLALCPLRLAPQLPDVVVVEGQVEPLMWLALADLNVHGGQRRTGDTAILQAACVDATIVPQLEQRLNFALGCYGCREATDLAPGETVVGFPGSLLDPLVAALSMLRAKALGRSRSKAVYALLMGRGGQTGDGASAEGDAAEADGASPFQEPALTG